MADLHIRRGPDEYTQGLASLLPQGRAWPRDPSSVLMRLLRGLADVWGVVIDPMLADLLERETDPRSTILLIEAWERALGLPDDCLSEPLGIEERQDAIVARLALKGGQSIPFFKSLAAALGYQIIIVEHSPFMAGISECGDTRTEEGGGFRWEVGPETMRFYWTIKVVNARLTWFRAGSGQAGVDHHLEIGIASDLECVMQRYKPAHTELAFDYSGVAANGSMAGTP